MQEEILIIDFGSQYTQLIARRIRELNVYSEIHPYNHIPEINKSIKGVILSGSPFSVTNEDAPGIHLTEIASKVPVLGICYGAQLIANENGGRVLPSKIREYGRAKLSSVKECALFHGIQNDSQVWMSHGDTIASLPENFEILAGTPNIPVAAYRFQNGKHKQEVYGIQFHPEVSHTTEGMTLLKNFVINICHCQQNWTPEVYIDTTVKNLKAELGNDKVVMGLSGGVDSTVAAMLLHKAIGKNLYCIFVDSGLLRKNEFGKVLEAYKHMGLNITGIDASEAFLNPLGKVEDPEAKRKAIGKTFIEVFDKEAHKIQDVSWLGQGTIYPDIIESASFDGPAKTIKSHHNVGGLPEKMKLKLVEPLKWLFKDEVRKVGKSLELDNDILNRHPFPGPGLAIRIIGKVSKEKIRILQEADDIFIESLKKWDLYDDVWQAAAILLPVQTVGVMGDERTYEFVIALRAVSSVDGMTADWCHLPYDFLSAVSNDIINKVKGVNRVVYDISSKPPSTIEWE